MLRSPWRKALVETAWLHDVGDSQALATTGFHALDDARWLSDQGWPSELSRLVAWQTEAVVEARLRDLGRVLRAADAHAHEPKPL